mgnify:CR=1 FL=1
MNRFFPNINSVDMTNLQIDDIGEYSITKPEEADLITQIIINETKDTDTILDAMAGSGGNTISFCTRFNKVISVESDMPRFDILKNNLDQYNFTNYTVFYDDCLNVIDKAKNNIIFFDPPWGGKNYLKQENVELSISGFKIWMILKYILSENKNCNIFLKIPSNFNLLKLKTELLSFENIKIFKFDIGKFLLLRIYVNS